MRAVTGGQDLARLGKRRRDNVPGGRVHFHKVRVSVEEEAALVVRAATQHVTVPRLLVEAALSAGSETPADRRNIAAELLGIRTLLATVANNVNQMAKHANTTGDLPANADATLTAVREMMGRIDDAVVRVKRP